MDSDDDDECQWVNSLIELEDEGLGKDDDGDDNIPENVSPEIPGLLVRADDDNLDSDDDSLDSDDDVSYFCADCDKTYQSERALKKHLETSKAHVQQREHSSRRRSSRTVPTVPKINVVR